MRMPLRPAQPLAWLLIVLPLALGACDRGVPWSCDCFAEGFAIGNPLIDASSEAEAVALAVDECNHESGHICTCECDEAR